MIVAIVGSRCAAEKEIEKIYEFLPVGASEIVSGGAEGIDRLAEQVALQQNLLFKAFLPNYKLFGRSAPIQRNRSIADYADYVIAFWDGKSKGTRDILKYCIDTGKPCKVIMI